MTKLRAEKVAKIADSLPPIEIDGDAKGDLLIIGWGGTCGAITGAVAKARAQGMKVSRIHLRHLNPFPRDLEQVMSGFSRVLVPELNSGQLALLLKSQFLAPVEQLNKVQGQPFKIDELYDRIVELVAV
jgi:2-oxoglutarate ferredoxin oxidoreductase subunit alpha